MFRLAYRNFGDHEAMVVTHAVTSGTSVGMRWYELRPSGGSLERLPAGNLCAERHVPLDGLDRDGPFG